MQIHVTRTTPIYNNPTTTGIFVQWNVSDPPLNTPIVFKVERSGSPEGPFEPVISNITTFHYFDNDNEVVKTRENLNFLSLSRLVYYRVTATAGTVSAVTTEPVGDHLPRRQMLLRRKMHRDIRVGFKFNSIPLVILKRKHWGLRCKKCFDQLTKKVTNSRCDTCYGTGFEGGYFDPVQVEGRVSVKSVQTQITEQDKVEVDRKTLTMLDYPIIESDDIVCELHSNKRSIVVNCTRTELRTVPVHQRAVISELSTDSIEYRLIINTAHIPVIY